MVQLGLVAPADGAQVAEFESLPIDSLWVGGHLASPNPSPEPVVWLARLAEQAQRVHVGTATLVLPWYQPAVAAKQLADIDRASKGKLLVGVGAGGEYPADFAAAGVPHEQRWGRLDESIGLLRSFWSGEPVHHRGRYFHYDGLRIHPAPVQTAGPPIIVTGRKPGAIRRAARLGDGWMPYLYSADQYARSVAAIKVEADQQGRNLETFRWMAYVMVAVAADTSSAKEAATNFLGTTYRQDFSQFIDRVTVTGTTDEVVQGLGEFVRAGARHLVLLPCSDPRSGRTVPWLAELVAALRTEFDARAHPPGSRREPRDNREPQTQVAATPYLDGEKVS